MASAAAARSIFRSSSVGRSAFRVASEAKPARSPFRIASNKPLSQSQSTLRFPVQLSFLCGIHDAIPHGHCFCAHDFHALHFETLLRLAS
ncbi:hypothetical protein SESBI_39508 [Sesbania bispinosa]|nr:hypothetical protein SESBI_39508 [Sesbania bispinosa]